MYMRLCGTKCALAITFLVADLYLALTADKGELKQRFMATLSDKEQERYQNIINERRNIYFKGYLVGIICSVLFLFLTRDMKKSKLMSAGVVCTVGGITLLVNYLYYILSPKSDFMIVHLDNKEQREAWLDIYRHMQVKYHTGLVLGVAAAMLAATQCI